MDGEEERAKNNQTGAFVSMASKIYIYSLLGGKVWLLYVLLPVYLLTLIAFQPGVGRQ